MKPIIQATNENDDSDEDGSQGGLGTITRDKQELKEPKMYKVLLLNDDYTTMDFVVAVLESIFQKSPSDATRIMLEVHQKGSGLCGVYPKEIAEAKVTAVEFRAQEEDFPLKCIMEEV
ncbi:MAG: ATP-dependent Clp protease adapter ClpS [Bdellovibrionales bacterium]|nr:ATP-dependent Clp protease adapter ClpS [Bdellovibrionales bacterium]